MLAIAALIFGLIVGGALGFHFGCDYWVNRALKVLAENNWDLNRATESLLKNHVLPFQRRAEDQETSK